VETLVNSVRGRRILFFLLYLTEGGPIGLLWWALPAHLRILGVPLSSITLLTSLLVLPWTVKFLWAPIVDASRARGTPLGYWIGSAQLMMAITLMPLLLLDPREDFLAMVIALLLHAVAASTQDAAIDAMAIRTVSSGERGVVNAAMQAGMLLGRASFGGSTLVLIGMLGFGGAVAALMVALILLAIWILHSSRRSAPPIDQGKADIRGMLHRAVLTLRSPSTRAGLLVALLAGAGFEGIGAVAGPYLIDRGYGASVVGMFFALGSTPAMLIGVFLGGRLADVHGRLPVTRAAVLLIAATGIALALTDPWMELGGPGRLGVLAGLYLLIGLFTASSYALFMDLTDPEIGATQFSTYMGVTNLCEAWSAFSVGRFASWGGYPVAFALLAIASLVSLGPLRTIGRDGAAGAAGNGITQSGG